MEQRNELRDPWVVGGLALLAILSIGAVLLYRSAPQSVEQARTSVWASVQSDGYAPQIARARERLRSARAAMEAERDSVALEAYDDAGRHAAAALKLADGDAQGRDAAALWAAASLESAELLLRIGTGQGLRPDDDEVLQQALERTQQVVAAPVDSAVQRQASELRERIERQLRPGPLEWLPSWRR